MTITLHKVSTSTAETAEYEGEHAGTKFRVTRLTDPNADGGSPETRWDGFVIVGADHEAPDGTDWALVAECYGSRRAAVAECIRWIDAHPHGR